MRTIGVALLLACLICVVLAIVGILHLRQSPDEITISIDKQRTAEVIQKGTEISSAALQKAGEKLKQLQQGSTGTEKLPEVP